MSSTNAADSLHERQQTSCEAERSEERGSYLSPEPELEDPNFAMERALVGRGTPMYAYASNNPVNRIDPNGRLDFGGGAGAAVGGAVGGTSGAAAGAAVGAGLGISAATIALICSTTGHYYDFCKFWFPPDKPQCEPQAASRRQICTAACPVIVFDPQPGITYPSWTNGTGSTCQEAEREARQKTPRGSRTRHCQCDCVSK